MARPDPLGERMKGYEAADTSRRAAPGQILLVRVDGRAFSRFTGAMAKPYDADLGRLMQATATYLVEVTGATVAYTQSDEISLVFDPDARRGRDDDAGPAEVPFSGRLHKIATTTASAATARFLKDALRLWPATCERALPTFDGRSWTVPSRREAAAALIWRELDAMRNAVSMAAQARFPHSALHRVPISGMLDMLRADGVDFAGMPEHFRRGSLFARETRMEDIPDESLAALPTHARPTGPVARTRVVALDVPPLRLLLNPADVLFDGAEPRTRPAGGPTAIHSEADADAARAELALLRDAIPDTPTYDRARHLERMLSDGGTTAAPTSDGRYLQRGL